MVSENGKKENPATTLFRDYIRINIMQPNPDYVKAMEFLIFVMTWEGEDPSLSSVMLNSHTDVVPVFPESWIHEPFSAFKDEKGNIYGRGT